MDTMGLLARKGWGKTTLIKMILRNIPKDRIIVLDTNLEYAGFNRKIPENYDVETLENFILYCRKFTNKLIIVEDIDLYLNSTFPPKELKNLFVNGSHQILGFMYTSKRPIGIPKTLLTEATHLIVGNFIVPADVNYLSQMGLDVEIIKKLQRYEFLCNHESGKKEIMKAKP